MPYPATRLRRSRRHAWSRALVAETRLTPADLIWPLFVIEGKDAREPVASLPGVERLSVDLAAQAAKDARDLGIPAVALFPNTPAHLRDATGREALNPDNLMCRAVKAIKDAAPEIGVITDVALDPYTSHGHDGLLGPDGDIANDATVAVLVEQALLQARAGADVIAPSDMMDGRIAAIRAALEADDRPNVQIMSYAAKYASAFYGPFRDAVGSSLEGDRRTYQQDPRNFRESLLEAELDIEEGADFVMVKPGLPYLDVLSAVAETSPVPVAVYQVSGEYAMLKAAAQNGWLDEKKVVMESLLCFRRAGADMILSYFSKQAAQWLKDA